MAPKSDRLLHALRRTEGATLTPLTPNATGIQANLRHDCRNERVVAPKRAWDNERGDLSRTADGPAPTSLQR